MNIILVLLAGAALLGWFKPVALVLGGMVLAGAAMEFARMDEGERLTVCAHVGVILGRISSAVDISLANTLRVLAFQSLTKREKKTS